jgi:protein phosphatase
MTLDPRPADRPRKQNVDIFGVSHPGNVRPVNQDGFLVATVQRTIEIHQTSLPPEYLPPTHSDNRRYVFLVADGVGGGPSGEEASGTALREVASYLGHTMDLYAQIAPEREESFLEDLKKAVERSHEIIRAQGEEDHDRRGMATTLTMVTIIWPRAYLIQVGDSRCYRLRNDTLELLTKDQTMAQAMVDAGVLTPEDAERSKLKHVLYSAVGGRSAAPAVKAVDCQWSDIMLICTDGLNKHVSDDEIREQLAAPQSSEQTCQTLLQMTLDRGASDNVTIIVARLKRS